MILLTLACGPDCEGYATLPVSASEVDISNELNGEEQDVDPLGAWEADTDTDPVGEPGLTTMELFGYVPTGHVLYGWYSNLDTYDVAYAAVGLGVGTAALGPAESEVDEWLTPAEQAAADEVRITDFCSFSADFDSVGRPEGEVNRTCTSGEMTDVVLPNSGADVEALSPTTNTVGWAAAFSGSGDALIYVPRWLLMWWWTPDGADLTLPDAVVCPAYGQGEQAVDEDKDGFFWDVSPWIYFR